MSSLSIAYDYNILMLNRNIHFSISPHPLWPTTVLHLRHVYYTKHLYPACPVNVSEPIYPERTSSQRFSVRLSHSDSFTILNCLISKWNGAKENPQCVKTFQCHDILLTIDLRNIAKCSKLTMLISSFDVNVILNLKIFNLHSNKPILR